MKPRTMCDGVTDEDAVQAMVKQIAQEVGVVDILSVNNAGIIKRIPDVRDDGGAVPAGGGRGPERAVHREQGGDPGMIERGTEGSSTSAA